MEGKGEEISLVLTERGSPPYKQQGNNHISLTSFTEKSKKLKIKDGG